MPSIWLSWLNQSHVAEQDGLQNFIQELIPKLILGMLYFSL